MAEPRHLTSKPTQPIGWPSHVYRYSLKTVMPLKDAGAGITILRNIRPELNPKANNKLPERWKRKVLPKLLNPEAPPPPQHKQQGSIDTATGQALVEERQHERSARSNHLDLRPPSACSISIKIPRPTEARWVINDKLDMDRVTAHLKEYTYHPGNFSTLYRSDKKRVEDMVNRLSYDPYERRERSLLAERPEHDDSLMYTKADIDAIVRRLYTVTAKVNTGEPVERRRKIRELTPKERALIERLSYVPIRHYERSAHKDYRRVVTKAELHAILQRLTQSKPERLEQEVGPPTKKVSPSDLETILSRLMTFDSAKWPPESKPHIYKLHANIDN